MSEQVNSQEENDDVRVKKFPQLSINPGFVADNDDTFGWGSPIPIWRRGLMYRYKENKYYGYKKIFYHDVDDITINVIPNRAKFTFECKIKIDTHLSKMDITNYLRQRLNNNDVFFLNEMTLESEIPATIIKAISKIKDYDISDNDDLHDFQQYLRQYSKGMIDYKINQATGNYIYSFIYGSNILVRVDSPPESDKNKERINMADDNGIVDFSFAMELWIPNNFLFECNTLPVGDYNSMLNESKVTIEHVFKTRPPEVLGEKVRLAWNKFVTDINVKVDKVPIESMFSNKVKDFIEDRVEKKDIDILNEIFEILVYRNEKPMKLNEDFRINWKTLEIEMIDPLFNYVYNVGIYANQDKLFNFIGVRPNTVKTY
jgi:hypothetical protein